MDEELQQILQDYQQLESNLLLRINQLSPKPPHLPEVPLERLFYIKSLLSTGGGGGGGGDASAENQVTQIELETLIKNALADFLERYPSALVGDRIPVDVQSLTVTVSNANIEISNDFGNPIPIDTGTPITGAILPTGGVNLIGWASGIWKLVSDRLPTLGTKTAALSFPVTLSSDGAFSANFGAIADAAATSDIDSFSFLSLFKRSLQALSSLNGLFMPAGTRVRYLGTSNGANLKASAGNVYAITCSNSNVSGRYFHLFSKPTPAINGDIPDECFPVYANDGLLLIGQDIIGGNGIALVNGISWGFSSTRLIYTAATALDAIVSVRYS